MLHSSHYTEWRSRNVFIAPFDKNHIFAFLVNNVADRIALVSLMFDHNFITRNVGTVDSDVENVVSSAVAVHTEAVLTAEQSLLKTFAPGFNLQEKIALSNI